MSYFNGCGVIWDVDGTLVDTAEMHFQAWEKLCRELQLSFTRADFVATFGRRNPEIFEYLLPGKLTPTQTAELGNRKESYYRSAAKEGVELLPGVRTLLNDLNAAGFRQAIGSSAPRENVELILELTQTAHYFQAVVAMEDTDRGKPDPQVFQVAGERLGVPPERCLVIEDAVAGVQAAKAGGMKCVAVRFIAHHPAERLAAAGADQIVDSLERLSATDISHLLSILPA